MMPPLYGIVLAGEASRRMGRDKAAIIYEDQPQLHRAYELLASYVVRCFVSLREDQKSDPLRGTYPGIMDRVAEIGPAAGLLAAHEEYPHIAWLVLACDLPVLDTKTLEALIQRRRPGYTAFAFQSEHDGFPEPLCTIWEPEALESLSHQVASGRTCPRQVLSSNRTDLLQPHTVGALDNINTPQERRLAASRINRLKGPV